MWLDGWKTSYAIKECWIVGDAGNVSERLQELTTAYASENICNMDDSDCFFKVLGDKGLVGKRKNQSKDSYLPILLMPPGKRSKSQLLFEWVESHVVLED